MVGFEDGDVEGSVVGELLGLVVGRVLNLSNKNKRISIDVYIQSWYLSIFRI